VLGEVDARMRHQERRARIAARRTIENGARLATVGCIERHHTLTNGGIDVAEINRIARLVIGRRRWHRGTPPSLAGVLPD
jgi:hypothetical protein